MTKLDSTQEELKEKTERWLERLEKRLKGLNESVEQMENVEAYKKDTYHFLEEEDFIRAWEAVIYAWGILETLERLGKFEES